MTAAQRYTPGNPAQRGVVAGERAAVAATTPDDTRLVPGVARFGRHIAARDVPRVEGIERMTFRSGRAPAEQDAIRRLTDWLARQFPDLSATDVERAVYGNHSSVEDGPIQDFVPVLLRPSQPPAAGRSTPARPRSDATAALQG